MIEAICNPWNDKFLDYVSKAKSDIRICCPFVKSEIFKDIYDYKKEDVKLELITRFKIANFYNEASDIDVFDFILNNNDSAKSFQALHAKIYLFDQKSVVITSANLTKQGLNQNYEYGIYTDERSIIEKVCNDYFFISNCDICMPITKEKVVDAKNIIKNAPPLQKVKFNEIELDRTNVDKDFYIGGSDSIIKGLSGWKLDIFKTICKINKQVFHLSDVYAYIEELQISHPDNQFIENKIRQTLQYLRDLEIIEFLGNGVYLKKYI